MALRVSVCQLEKGNYLVPIHAIMIDDTLDNKLINISLPTTTQKQDTGPKGTKIIDLLRITRIFKITGYITGSSTSDSYPAKYNGVAQNLTANQVKNYLIQIIKGAGIKGGEITFTYPDGGDNTSYNVYIKNCLIKQASTDEPDTENKELAKFEVHMTLVEGTKM